MPSRFIHSMVDRRSSSTDRSMPLRAESAWRRNWITETPGISCGYWKARNMPALQLRVLSLQGIDAPAQRAGRRAAAEQLVDLDQVSMCRSQLTGSQRCFGELQHGRQRQRVLLSPCALAFHVAPALLGAPLLAPVLLCLLPSGELRLQQRVERGIGQRHELRPVPSRVLCLAVEQRQAFVDLGAQVHGLCQLAEQRRVDRLLGRQLDDRARRSGGGAQWVAVGRA